MVFFSPLTITVFPRITRQPRSQNVLEDNSINISCEAEGPPQLIITWSVEELEGVEMNSTDLKNGLLVLQNVKSKGRYTFTVICIASNKGGKTTANATITILGKYFLFLLIVTFNFGKISDIMKL